MASGDQFQALDYADRWLGDSFRVIQERPPGYAVIIDVEMTRVRALLRRTRESGTRATITGALLRAAALALARHPQLHYAIGGSRKLVPGQVDLALSVANEAVAAPLLLLQDVARKSLAQLGAELLERVPKARADDSKTLGDLRRWGWLVPFGFLRRAILRLLFGSLRLRRRLGGSLQITVVPNLDVVIPHVVVAPALLALGRVSERVVARGGQPVVREMATLVCCADHKVWDGQRVGLFLGELQRILENEDLDAPETGAESEPTPTAASIENR